ncbi:hypothetical protein AAE478_008693 [Parahypoxylon ruwenzoriense]
MFGSSRRHRPPNPCATIIANISLKFPQPLNSATANPNAASAAATAFMSASNQKPNRTLSSAAAAAALRARPHTPTNVGEVQTKRTMRRSASVSSSGSAPATALVSRPTGQLERKPSSGSMTERTFRTPSPRRTTSTRAAEERPPVPQIPEGHKKSASLASVGVGMQIFRTASQKMKTGHTSWYTQPSGDPNNVRTSDAPMRTSTFQPSKSETATTTTQRPDSRSSSVNFSYPTAFRAQSPPSSPSSSHAPQLSSPPPRAPVSPPRSNRASISSVTSGQHDQPMVYDPNSRRMVPKATVDAVEYRAKEVAERKSKKKKNDGLRREGSQLAKGKVARIKGTTIDTDASERELPKREQPVLEEAPTKEESQVLQEPGVKAIITMPEKRERDQDELRGDRPIQSQNSQKSRFQSPPSAQPVPYDRNPSPPAKETPVVQEEPEERYEQPDPVVRSSQKALDALDAVPTRQYIFEQPGQQRPADSQHPKQVESPVDTPEPKAAIVENKLVTELSREENSAQRSASSSPARQARFVTAAKAASDNLTVRHAPLPRSASPIKSALKRTSPTPREVSPSDKGSDVSGSRGVSPHQQDLGIPRKKSARVSFDDRTMAKVVGESSPSEDADPRIPPSPQQVKRPWYSTIGRNKRREFVLDDDEIMKPRPALPSFGSIRERRTRDAEERPLVRPQEPSYSPVAPSSPELRPSSPSLSGEIGTPEELSLNQSSSDQVIGSVLAREQTQRNAPNISRFREPLPPVVTSVEGDGYISDSLKSSDSDDDLLDSDAEFIPSTQTTQLETINSPQSNTNVPEQRKPTNSEEATSTSAGREPQEVPEISIIQPSPRGPEHNGSIPKSLEGDYFDVPGGFPAETDACQSSHTTSKNAEIEAASGVSSSPTILEPKPTVHPVQPGTLPQTTLATTAPLGATDDEGSTDSSEGSIYSDAYDDLSNVVGDGYISLDAVVERPVGEDVLSQLHELPGDAPEKTVVKEAQPPQTNDQQPPVTAKSPEPPRDQDDWEKAKAFWRNLTAEKRLQLEREAMGEAGTEGDEDEVTSPVRRNSGRKKSTRQQHAATEAQARIPTQPPDSVLLVDPERAYLVQPESKPSRQLAKSQTSSRTQTSLRGEQPTQALNPQASNGMRKTMRSQPRPEQISQPSTDHTAQRGKPTPTSSRPKSIAVPSQTPPSNTPRNILPSERPPLQRQLSDVSDSSFKRNRATRSGGFTLRTSMRPQTAVAPPSATKGSGRFSLRSLSPAGSTFRPSSATNPVSGVPSTTMRRTMRSSSVSSQDRILSSIHFPSFGRSNKAPAANRAKRSSRFGDLSDEDEGGIPGFRSRFGDSSDEDSIRPGSSLQASPLTRGTLRGSATGAANIRKSTPVPEADEGSPELPDSDDDTMPSPLQSPLRRANTGSAGLSRTNSEALGTATLTRSRSGRGAFNTSVSIPTASNKDRRSSLLGILRRNKRADQTGKIQRSELTESAARRDTRLERSSEQLRDIRDDHTSSPRLQKRGSVKRNDSWPLGEPTEGEVMKRSTSEGDLLNQNNTTMTAIQGPGPSGRRTASLGLPTTYDNESNTMTADGPGYRKKKKFGALRRMFGLDD